MRIVTEDQARAEYPDLGRPLRNGVFVFEHERQGTLPRLSALKNELASWLVTELWPDAPLCIRATGFFPKQGSVSGFAEILQRLAQNQNALFGYASNCMVFEDSEIEVAKAMARLCLTNLVDCCFTTSRGGLAVQVTHHEALVVGGGDLDRVLHISKALDRFD